MTDETVHISIHVKVEGREEEFDYHAPVAELEEAIQSLSQQIGQQILLGVIGVLDDRTAKSIPASWRNAGTEERWMVSSVGAVRYKRRIIVDENGKRREPVDEIIGLQHYG